MLPEALQHARRLLIFGGMFDPPHVAHLALPMLAAEAVGADALAYVPTGIPPHKAAADHSPAHHRAAMLGLALEALPHAHVLTHEIEWARQNRLSYTAASLHWLTEQLPGVELRLLIGADQLRLFDTWKDPQRIVELAQPVVMVRPPDDRQTLLSNLPAGYDPDLWGPRLVELPQLDVSSTLIRLRIAADKPIAGLVAPAVANYIHQHGLYKTQ